MTTKVFRFPGRAVFLVTALLVYGSQMHGQLPDQRTAPVRLESAAARPQLPRIEASTPLVKPDGNFISFDAPGAGNVAYSGTYAVAINPAGEIAGYSFDSNGIPIGFVRSESGKFTTFGLPGATFYNYGGYGPPGSTINPSGEVTNFYYDANSVAHGFVRDSHGSITTFDAPGADTVDVGAGTIPLAINPAGEITGYYYDANFFGHGFLRDSSGKVTDFDAPGASSNCYFGLTYPQGIGGAGNIAGNYLDSQCFPHGFLRKQNGEISTIDAPGYVGTSPQSISVPGQITGVVYDATGGSHGFVRDKRGTFTTFDIPGVNIYAIQYSTMNINPAGVIVGEYYDGTQYHGFARSADGILTVIDAPDAGTGQFQGTSATSVNPSGKITGFFLDANNIAHGFLFLPH